MVTDKNMLQLKIILCGSKPAIWRTIIVSADYSFFALHVAIQDSFGWTDSHLHQFFTESPYKRSGRSRRIAFPMPEMEDEDSIDERKTKLKRYFSKPKTVIFYEYDFGDSWMHEIKLEKIVPKNPKARYPLLVGGESACPPEDSGGLGGFYQLLDILKHLYGLPTCPPLIF